VILGAGGFLGRHLIASGKCPVRVKAVARRRRSDRDLRETDVVWLVADLLSPGSLDDILEPDDVVLNLAFLYEGGDRENIRLVENVTAACLRARVARFVHCSSAVVVGATKAPRVTEATICEPLTKYERIKSDLEGRVLSAHFKGLDVAIVRPTAIVGPGGHNLRKLAQSLAHGNRVANYLRACLFDKRPMHLVPAGTVVAALLHIAFMPPPAGGNVYIVSSDDDPSNNFKTVETILMKSLGLTPRRVPLIPVLKRALPVLLRVLGRSETAPDRNYDAAKLRATNFRPVESVEGAVREFGRSITNEIIAVRNGNRKQRSL